MNPFALIVIAIAIGLLVVGVKGTQDNFISAIKGKPYGNTVLT